MRLGNLLRKGIDYRWRIDAGLPGNVYKAALEEFPAVAQDEERVLADAGCSTGCSRLVRHGVDPLVSVSAKAQSALILAMISLSVASAFSFST